jgi:hypothetical protein
MAMPGMGTHGTPAAAASVTELESRLERMEQRLRTYETIIEAALRPELVQGALTQEEELEAGDGRMVGGGGPGDTRPLAS